MKKIKIKSAKSRFIIAASLIVLISFFTHFIFFNNQKVAIFDEVYFGAFANNYLNREYFFDIHPPLGKLLIAGSSAVFSADSMSQFVQNEPGAITPNFAAYRLMPAIFASLLPLAIFLLACSLKIPLKGAFFAGLLVALENSIIAHSRLVLIDSMFLAFGFFGLWAYIKYRSNNNTLWLAASALLCGASLSVKWAGLSFLALVIIFETARLVNSKKSLAVILKFGLIIIVLPLVLYMATFAVHFSILNKTGTGDAFMSESFQSTLKGSQFSGLSNQQPSFISKFIELNKTMYSSSASISTYHPYSSKWYGWPILKKPIAYYNQYPKIVHFIGNPIIWLSSLLALIITTVAVIINKKLRSFNIYILLAGFYGNWLIFALISRVAFLYHYLAALLFGILILSWLISKFKWSKQIYSLLAVLALLFYIFLAPVTYGLDLSTEKYDYYNLLLQK